MKCVDAPVEAYYAHLANQPLEGYYLTEEDLQDVYWVDPEVTAASVGSIDNLRPTNGKVRVPVSTALYLINVRPDLFSAVPPAKASAAATTSAPKETKE